MANKCQKLWRHKPSNRPSLLAGEKAESSKSSSELLPRVLFLDVSPTDVVPKDTLSAEELMLLLSEASALLGGSRDVS